MLTCLWCDKECAIEHMIIMMGQTSCEYECTFSLAFIGPGILTGRKGRSSARLLPWQAHPHLQNPSDVLQEVERAVRIQTNMYSDRPHLWVRYQAASTVPSIVKVREGPIWAINNGLSASPPPTFAKASVGKPSEERLKVALRSLSEGGRLLPRFRFSKLGFAKNEVRLPPPKPCRSSPALHRTH